MRLSQRTLWTWMAAVAATTTTTTTTTSITTAFVVSSKVARRTTTSTSTTTPFSPPPPLFGILDEVNSDAYTLGAPKETGGGDDKLAEAYDIFLAELVFSRNDPRMDIVDNYERCTDEGFLKWLTKKVESSKDPEESLALRDLHELILDVQKKVQLSQQAQEREQAEEEAAAAAAAQAAEAEEAQAQSDKSRSPMSSSDVLRKAAALKTGGVSETMQASDAAASGGGGTGSGKGTTFYDTDLTPEIRQSYHDLVQKILPPYAPGETVESVVQINYSQLDAQLVKLLNERADNGDADATLVLEQLATEQQVRMAAATETLKTVLSKGDVMRMQGAIVQLAREQKIDEAFLLLLEANAAQAQAAGATEPAQVMRQLKQRAQEELDKLTSAKEVALLRRLLRTPNAAQREVILEDAFTPKEQLLVPGTAENAQKAMTGEAPEEEKPMPEVPPPDFIKACKAALLNFGNIANEEGDLATRIKEIASEAEVVATRIYGKGMTPKEQQDFMWNEQTTSVFDLERMELEAEAMGETAPWANPDMPEMLPGFDDEGRMQVGGS